MTDIDQKLIKSSDIQHKWLPYLVALLGFSLSVLVWYITYSDLRVYTEFMDRLEASIPWIALITGLILTFVLFLLVRTYLLTQAQAGDLARANEKLRQEIHDSNIIKESKQKLEHALLQGQKLQAMGTLAGGIAHDFNNILYAIIGYVEMAREDVEKDSLLHKNLGQVLEACQRGQELVARILTFSRRQQHQLDALDVQSTIENVLSLLQQTIPASVILDFSIKDNTTIFGNRTLIHQVLVNLINNAVDAMDGEGNINIQVDIVDSNNPYLAQFPAMKGKKYCKIEVSDTGHGMEKSTMERIFEPFYTTKEVGKGTGLGLSIVHSIIKDHNGEIMVNSELGKGTTFTILLPEYTQQ
jgi:signal transduction histidine kinase